MRSTLVLAAGAATLSTAAGMCTLPASDPNMLAWVEEAVMPMFTTVSAPRQMLAAGDPIEDGTYFVSFCADDYAEDYSCVVKCDGDEIDYSLCGPGGDAGKGESFVVGQCVAPRLAAVNANCNVDFESDDEVLSWPSFDPATVGELKTMSWKQYWATAYDYAVRYASTQNELSFRYGEGDSFLPHTTGNLIKLGMAFSQPDFRKTSFTTEYHGFFVEVVEDWLPTLCANHYNATSGEMIPLQEGIVGELHYAATTVGVYESTYVDLCGYLDSIPNRGFSGKVDLVGNVNLFTMTSSSTTVSLGPQEGPYDYNGEGAASTMVDASFSTDFPYSLIPAEDWIPEGWDPSASDGDVFWPELGAAWHCVEPFIPTGDADGDGVPECPQMMIFATSSPETYTFDLPVQIDVVGGGSYDACDWYHETNVTIWGQADPACFHMHQGGPHLRTGGMAPFYPLLLDGTPDFFGVCSSVEMEKAYYVHDTEETYPGVNYFDTGSDKSAQFELTGGVTMFHGKSYGIHFCTDPDDVYNPYVCLLNKEAGLPHLEGVSEQLILSPLSFSYEAYTDRENNCMKSMKHYCPYDDYWMTVTEVNDLASGNRTSYGGYVTEINDFASAQAACMADPADCDPAGVFVDTMTECATDDDCEFGMMCSTEMRRRKLRFGYSTVGVCMSM